jgi:putative hydrolase of the HAD superfamily
MATAIKAVLFDFGGVLAEEGFRNGLQALAREQGLDVYGMPRAAM